MNKSEQINLINQSWEDKRWDSIERPYTAEDVYNLRGSQHIEHSLARLGAERLWKLLHEEKFLRTLGALTGNQAVQQVQAGLKAIYLSGWQVAADANNAGQTYPDQSLYPADSVPSVVKRINNALLRSDQISHMEGKDDIYWLAPIIADAEAGFGGTLNVFELMKAMIEAGAAGVHFEDQLSSAKKCGHLGGKVLVSTREFINTLVSARLASDIMGVPTILLARTDANSANLLTNDIDDRDQKFIHGDGTFEGFFNIKGGLECAIERGLSYAPFADLIWCETAHPDIDEAKQFISISFFEGNKSTKNKSLDIWKYRVSQHFNDKLKASVFNEIANERRDIYANNSGRPTPPVNCGCHDASDFCSRLNYTVLFCSHYFTCDTDTDCLPEDSGCGWFWAESCDGKCIEYTTGAC